MTEKSESWIMFDEVQFWLMKLEKLRDFAVELGSKEQDIDFLNNHIHALIDEFTEEEPDEDGNSASYTLHFEDDRQPRILHIHFSARITDE